MKKRIVSILLTLCMVLMLVPITAFAANDDATELQNLLNDGDTVTLEKDYTITSTIEVNNTVNLDLNGHVIKGTGDGFVIKVNRIGNLTLEDSNSTAEHDDKTLPAGGVITTSSNMSTYGVSVYGGSFTMNGGTIYKFNIVSAGGGVRVENNGIFTMTGGAIYDCSADIGGGVAVVESSFTMTGGAIYDCSANIGGGVNVADSSFTMNGGVIYGCSAKLQGDAVWSNIGSNIYANGGTIKGTVVSFGKILNTATDGGCTRFYDEVTNATTDTDHGTISGGIYYGGISGGGTVEGTYHTVSFDLNGGSGSILKQWFVNIDTAQALEPVAPTREGYEFAGWYNGDTKYEFTESVTDNITLTAQWKDIEKPVITVLENQKTYCDEVQFEVSDNDGVASVTANDAPLTPNANNKYALEKGKGTVTVLAKDKAGNETSVTVTVNNGHTAGNDDGDCSTPVYCIYHPDTVVIEAKSHDFSGDWNKNTDVHWHACQNEGCTVTDTPQPHSGGSATCTAKAECEYCGEEYGELDSTNHNLEKIPAKDATVTATGNKEYWHCKDCGKYFADEKGENEIALADTVIAKLPPEIIKGAGQSITQGESKALSFTSNAAFSDFIRVELDGKTLDEKNYTVKEGSTVVTLKADYVATLSVGEHTIGIVSESGTATTTFTVNAKAVVDYDTNSPQTGDSSHMALWIALLFVSGAGVIGITVYGKKKRAK